MISEKSNRSLKIYFFWSFRGAIHPSPPGYATESTISIVRSSDKRRVFDVSGMPPTNWQYHNIYILIHDLVLKRTWCTDFLLGERLFRCLTFWGIEPLLYYFVAWIQNTATILHRPFLSTEEMCRDVVKRETSATLVNSLLRFDSQLFYFQNFWPRNELS